MMDEGTSRAEILGRAQAEGLVSDESPCALFFDQERFARRCRALKEAFPVAFHTVAVKALPLPKVLEKAVGMGLGLEVASVGEVAIAKSLDLPAERVVFDSPAKTRGEIADALRWGCRLNVDNFQELERVAELGVPSGRGVGLRVNPVLDGARISATFTGGPTSKFGIRLDRFRDEIVRAFLEHPWLEGLHVHIGSQGCPLELLVDGVERVDLLAEELRAAGAEVRWLDIGGGLPVAYRPEDRAVTFADYAEALKARCPRLFDGTYEVLTEFGRALLAPCGWVASRVESTRTGITENTAVIHVGADLFVRTAYRPEDWYHGVRVHAADGTEKTPPADEREEWSIAGPLCFAGDYVATHRRLPPIAPGDFVVIEDAGAYTIGMWSKYNSRLAPPVLGHDAEGELMLLKPRETLDDLLRFWGG